MVEQVAYRTDLGVVAAAQAQHNSGLSSKPSDSIEDGALNVVRTAAGMNLLVTSLVATYRYPSAEAGEIDRIQQQIVDFIHVSTGRNIPAMLKDALQQVNTALFEDPRWHGAGLTAVVAAVYGRRLYLAQVGNCRAYLLHASRAVQLTQDHTLVDGATLSTRGSEPLGPGSLLRYLGKDRNVYVDTQIHLPGGVKGNYLDLGPNDGVVLCTDGVVDRVLRQDALLGEDFFAYFQDQPVEMAVERLTSISARKYPQENHAVVVLKADEDAAPVPVLSAGSCLSQVGIIASILVLSILLGLGAAFGLPALMNTKGSSIPNTGASLVQPGYLAVVSADGLAQLTYPGQAPQPMATGTLLEARDGSQISTAKGKAKIQLVDGTAIYIDESSSLTLKTIANPKQNQNSTLLVLNAGGVLVDTSRTTDVVSVILTVPGTAHGSAIGQFIGARFSLDQKRLDIDCLEGHCQVSGSSASRDLAAGQRSSITNGVVGAMEAARWDLWASLCDSDCPLLAQAAAPTPAAVLPQASPTYVPTPAVPIPYLGANIGINGPSH